MHSQKIVCHCGKVMELESDTNSGVEECEVSFKCSDGHKIEYYGAIGREMSRNAQAEYRRT
jgi:hypothetical protein